jgi:hypothetical protein
MHREHRRSDATFTGVFLIGLALLFITSYWWPGVMFVIGGAMIARSMSEGQQWTDNRSAVIVLAIGVVFAVGKLFSGLFSGGLLLPLVLIGVGVYLLFGNQIRGQMNARMDETRKAKNEESV